MIKKNTVLILGAGASCPFGFPTGLSLLNKVYDNLFDDRSNEPKYVQRPDPNNLYEESLSKSNNHNYGQNIYDRKSKNPLLEMLLDLDFREKDIQNFRISLKLSQLSSVDAFLENRPEFIPIGKMAIAYTLLQDEDPDFIAKDCNWYNFLWGKLHCPFDNFQENKLSIITFNYDRSIEFFLMNAMKHTYGKSIKECYEKLSSIPIIHLHGKLGSLPWEGDDYTKFGAEIQTKNELKKVGEKIKIIHEDISTNEEFTSAFNMIANAERIYFLGLSYSETNIQRLKIPILDVNGKDIRGSVLNLSSTQIEDIKQFTNRKIALAHSSYDCLMFLKEFAPLN